MFDVDVFTGYSPDFLEIQLPEIAKIYPNPTLLHIKGRRSGPLFISTLLHGNEPTSFYATQKLLQTFCHQGPPQDLIIFIGNPQAASLGLRQMENGPDFNRIWDDAETEAHKMAKFVMDYAKKNEIVASVDLHNNTGKNPHYGCVNFLDKEYLKLAAAFSKQVVYFTEPHQVQSMAFGQFCPATTLECGQAHQPEGTEHAFDFLMKILDDDFDLSDDTELGDIEVFHTLARILINENALVDFDGLKGGHSDLSFIENFDDYNFTSLGKGTELGFANDLSTLVVEGDKGANLIKDYLEIKDQTIVTKKEFTPSMFSKDEKVILSDCLGYIMERFPL